MKSKSNRVKSPEIGAEVNKEGSEVTEEEVNHSEAKGGEEVNKDKEDGQEAAETTKEEDITARSDDLSSLSVLPVDEEEDKRISQAMSESNQTLEELDNTVIRAESLDQTQPPVGEEPLSEGAVSTAGGILIIKDYEEDQQEPDKQSTPPADPTGHIQFIQAYSQGQTINSEKKDLEKVNPELKRKLFGALAEAAPEVPDPDTAQKIAKESPVD